MIRIHPTSFSVDGFIYFFLFKKKYFFFVSVFLKLILILLLFIFRLISLVSFILFIKPIWNDDYFLNIHLIF